jgi:hypothetical protein
MKNQIELGVVAKCKVTGFKGVITGHCRYLTGCDTYLVQPETSGENNTWVDSRWFDVNRLEFVEEKLNIEDFTHPNGADLEAPIK